LSLYLLFVVIVLDVTVNVAFIVVVVSSVVYEMEICNAEVVTIQEWNGDLRSISNNISGMVVIR
jgi:hypothetical protein